MKIIAFIVFFYCIQLVTAQIENPTTSIKNNPVSYTEKIYLLDSTNHKKLQQEKELFKKFDELKLTYYGEKIYDSIQNIYNDKNLLIEQKMYRFYTSDSIYSVREIRKFTYNTTGLLEKIEEINRFSKEVEVYFTYKFDKNGNIKSVKKHYANQDVTKAIDFTYKNGRVIKKTYSSYGKADDGKSVELYEQSFDEFTYDKIGRLIEKKTIHAYNYSYKFTYNNKNEMIKMDVFVAVKSDKKKEELKKLQTTYYKKFDKFGNPTVMTSEKYKNGKTTYWINEREYQY